MRRIILFCVAAALAPFVALAQPTSTGSISFQGVLSGANGQPLTNGNYNLTFRFYETPTGGTALATTNVLNVPVSGGIASTPIQINPTTFDGRTLYLGIAVNGGQELSPRVLVTAVPHSVYSLYSEATRGVKVKENGSVTIGPSVASDALTVVAESGRQAVVLANTNASIRPFQLLMDGWDPISGANRFGFFLPFNHAAGHQAGPDAAIYWDGSALSFGSPNDNRPVFKVGIGTKTPQTELEISGTTRTTVLQITSDRNAKRDFEHVDSNTLLEKLATLPVFTWAYTNCESVRHIGPVAQDFKSAFGVGSDDKHIATVDADGVALATIQALYRMVMAKEAKILELEQRIEALERGIKPLNPIKEADL